MTPTIWTYGGRAVNPLELQPLDINIESIAHSLSLLNRFNGHTIMPISVAQHAVFVSGLLTLADASPYTVAAGLHHDDAEAFLGDMTKWVKSHPSMVLYREAENRAQEVCYTTLLGRLPSKSEQEMIDWADRVMVRFEGVQGFGSAFVIDHPHYPPLTTQEHHFLAGQWAPWASGDARQAFLQAWKSLQISLQRNAGETAEALPSAQFGRLQRDATGVLQLR